MNNDDLKKELLQSLLTIDTEIEVLENKREEIFFEMDKLVENSLSKKGE